VPCRRSSFRTSHNKFSILTFHVKCQHSAVAYHFNLFENISLYRVTDFGQSMLLACRCSTTSS
jgi:hypothetical protein